MTPAVIQDGLVGEVEHGLGLQLDDGLMQQGPGVTPRPKPHALELDPPPLGQLLGPARDNAPNYLVPLGLDLFQGGLYDRGVVLAVDYNEISDGCAP
ncbi:MAG: hypothetical protein M3198_00090 [Actinomycetota bacterium]|nr:hypothetical protein [Actinomycetota bacterium]